MKKVFSMVLMILLASVLLVGCNGGEQAVTNSEVNNNGEVKELMVYSGAGLRKPMDEIGVAFKEKYGVQINYSYAGSAQNLSQIELIKEGDAYVPGAKSYIDVADEKGFITSKKDVVYHIPAIAVPKGNPANIKCLNDFSKPGVKVVLGDERSAAIGKVTKKILEKNNILEAVEKNVVTKDATVNEVVVHTAMKQGDACIIWEDNVIDVEEIEVVSIPEEDNIIKTIPVGSLSFSKNPELAQQFVDFVSSEEGKSIFEKHGFKRVN